MSTISDSGWQRTTSPYHRGEQELHERLNRKDQQERDGRRVTRSFMPRQHRDFFKQLPYILVGGVDASGWPWASILFGPPGFVTTPNSTTLRINAHPIPGDPLTEAFETVGSPIGLLGIEFPTRRRNRANGVVSYLDASGVEVHIVQSFGNCPQYINARTYEQLTRSEITVSPIRESFQKLDEESIALILRADTFFVASFNNKDDKYDNGGADVSHRGGRPGFVQVDGNELTIPDFVGNFFFNTLGNFVVNPRAGLLFLDFSSGDILQVTGTVELLWDVSEEIRSFRGAERAWRLRIENGVRLKSASPLRWSKFGEPSRNSLLTGTWTEAKKIRAAQVQATAWRPFEITRIAQESSVIRSVYLEPSDGCPPIPFQPGQYLTIRIPRLTMGREGRIPIRTYTLSSGPSDPWYRISVKCEAQGLMSKYLHESIEVGHVIEARAPTGSFTLDVQATRPAVLVAAGVGVTPMISMVREAVTEGIRRRHIRPLTVFHVTRTTADRAFVHEMKELELAGKGSIRYLSFVTQPSPDSEGFHEAGRLTPLGFQRYLPLDDYDFYICGPTSFMQDTYNILNRKLGVRDGRIFAESFGPSSLSRCAEDLTVRADPAAVEPAHRALVHFQRSDVRRVWTPENGTLLEFAESQGITPEYGCRSGACGTCAVRILAGKVTHRHAPTFPTNSEEVLICCAVPAKSDLDLVLDF